MCFQGKCWSRVEVILREVAMLLRKWMLLNKPEEVEILEAWALKLEQKSARHPRLMWHQASRSLTCDDEVELSDELNNTQVNVVSECVEFVTLTDPGVRLDVQRCDTKAIRANMHVVSE
jgi:hypothetical protein